MEIIRIRVALDGDSAALTSLRAIDNEITRLNSRSVNITPSNQSAQSMIQLQDHMTRLNELTAQSTQTSRLWGDTWNMIRYTAIAAGIAGVTGAMASALSTMKSVDTELTNIQKVSNMTGAELEKLGSKAYSTASAYGVAADEYLSAVYTFQKAGLGDSAEKMGELAVKTMLVGDTTADVASQFLVAANAAWDLNGSYAALSKVVDEADYINNNYATDLAKLSAGMPIVASTAANVGMSIEETMAMLGTITAKTQETGTKAATAARALIMNITGELGTLYDETGDAIEVTESSIKSMSDALKLYGSETIKAAQATGQIIDPMEAIISLADAYKDGLLTDAKLESIMMEVGGKLRTNQLTALVKDLASETSTYYDMMEKLGDAAGTADAEIGVMLSSWERKTAILGNTWTEFVQNTVKTDFVKGILDASTAVLDFGDNLGLVVGEIAGVTVAIKTLTAAHKAAKASEEATALAAEIATLAEKGQATELQKLTAQREADALAAQKQSAANKAALGYIGAGVTAAILLYQTLKQIDDKQLETAQKAYNDAVKAAEADEERLTSLTALSAKYDELIKNGGSLDEIQGVQDEINELLADQKTAVDLVNGAYKEQKGILDGVIGKVSEKTEKELFAAKAAAETVLREMADNVIGLSRTAAIYSAFTGSQTILEMQDIVDPFARATLFGSVGSGSTVIPQDADALLEWYDALTTAIGNYQDAYLKRGDSAGLSKNSIYQNLLALQQEFEDAVEAYRTYSEALEKFGEDSQEAADAAEELDDTLNEFSDAAEKAADSLDAITAAKEKLDKALQTHAEDEAFKTISEVVNDFRDLIDTGEINSKAFWNTAEFLFGPEVLEEYYGNAKGLVELFESSELEEVFGGAKLDDFIDRLRKVDDAIATVTEDADGAVSYSVKDISALADAWGLTETQVLAVLEAMEAYGALDFTGNGLVEYLEYLGVSFEDGVTTAGELKSRLQELGYTDQYVADVVEQLDALGAVALTAADDADDTASAVERVDNRTLDNVTSEFTGLLSAAAETAAGIDNVSRSVDSLDGKTATITFTTNYVTNGQGFAEGTSNAPGGPALVGDEASPDGSPRPELVRQNGRAFLAGVNGPEIVNLAPGAQVYPYAKTRQMMSGASYAVSFPAYSLGTAFANVAAKNQADNTGNTTTNNAYVSNLVTVSFSANGGSGAPGSMSVTKNKSFTLPATKPTRSGYTFTGWARGSANGREIYQPRGTCTLSAGTTFYAQWSKITDAAGGVSGTYTTTTTTTSGGGGYSGGGYSGGGSSGGSSSSSTASSPLDDLMDELQEKLTDMEFAIWLGKKTGDMTNGDISAAYAEMMALVNTYIDKYREKGEDDNSDYIQKLIKQWWGYSDEVSEIQSDLVDEMEAVMKERLADAEDEKDARIQAIKDEAQAAEDLNTLEEKRLALLEAQNNLLNAQSERTVRIYNAATGQWEWVANAADVKSAQEALDSAQKAWDDEIASREREARIAAIEAEYDALADEWDDILDSLEDAPRTIAEILKDAQDVGTERNAAAIARALALEERIAASILGASYETGGGIMYGASPYATDGGAVYAAAVSGGDGVSYYINGVEISGERAETLTVAELARSLSALAIYNNS